MSLKHASEITYKSLVNVAASTSYLSFLNTRSLSGLMKYTSLLTSLATDPTELELLAEYWRVRVAIVTDEADSATNNQSSNAVSRKI